MDEKLELLERISRLLDTFPGRDKAIRTTYFSLLLLANRMHDRQKADKLVAFAKQLSRTRLVARMFSQPSLLLSTIRIPRDLRNSKDRLDTALASSTTILYLFCGWSELVGWLAEAGLMRQNPARWFQYSLRMWVVALSASLVRSLRQIHLRIQRDRLQMLSLPSWNKAQQQWLKDQLIGIIGTCADFAAAVNSLPAGMLWAGKMSGTQNSTLFLLASIIGVYRLWH